MVLPFPGQVGHFTPRSVAVANACNGRPVATVTVPQRDDRKVATPRSLPVIPCQQPCERTLIRLPLYVSDPPCDAPDEPATFKFLKGREQMSCSRAVTCVFAKSTAEKCLDQFGRDVFPTALVRCHVGHCRLTTKALAVVKPRPNWLIMREEPAWTPIPSALPARTGGIEHTLHRFSSGFCRDTKDKRSHHSGNHLIEHHVPPSRGTILSASRCRAALGMLIPGRLLYQLVSSPIQVIRHDARYVKTGYAKPAVWQIHPQSTSPGHGPKN